MLPVYGWGMGGNGARFSIKGAMKLIIQIPCFNEAETLPTVLSQLPRTVDGVDVVETLVVDDGSSDGTVDAARRLGVTHVVELGRNQGLGIAFRTGLDAGLKLGADIIVNTDGDNQYRGTDVGALIRPIVQGEADLVVGSRDISAISYFSPTKKWLQRLGSWFVRTVAHCPVDDTTSGFRAYSREAALRTIVHTRFSYTLETVIQAGASQLRVTSVPIQVNRKLRESRLARSTWYYLKKSVATILRIYTMYNPLRAFLWLGGVSFLLGFLLGLRYLYFFFIESAGGHIQSLILASILMILGFQIIVIGLVADLIGANRRISEETLYRVRKLELSEGRGVEGSQGVAAEASILNTKQ